MMFQGKMMISVKEHSSGSKEGTINNRLGWGLFVILVICGMVVIEAVNSIRLLSEPKASRLFPQDYVSKGVWSFFAFIRPLDVDGTDVSPMLRAVHRVLNGDTGLYRDFNPASSFVYPPTAVIELAGLGYLVRGDDFSAAFKVWDLVSRICILLTVCIGAFFLRGVISYFWQWVLAVLILFAFFPLRWSAMCMNVQSLITLLLVLMTFLYAKGFDFLAGVMLGLAACLKPNVAPLLFFATFHRRWRFMGAAVSVALILIAASIAAVGYEPWKTYLFEWLPVMARGYGYWPNHSLNGLVHRWLGHPTSMVVGPVSMSVYLITRLGAVVFLILSVWPRPVFRYQQRDVGSVKWYLFRAMDISMALIFVMLISPIVWDHYYAWCIALFTAFFAVSSVVKLSLWDFISAAVSYLLLGTYFLTVKGANSGLPSLVNSTHFFGVLLLSVLAWRTQLKLWREMVCV
jgi:hypothetical protein